MTYKPVPWDNKFRKEILEDPESRTIYEATKLQIELSMKLKKARKEQKMTQDDVAKIMHTKKPNISRLESGDENIKNFPSLLTLVKFSSAIGYKLKIGLIPTKKSAKTKSRK